MLEIIVILFIFFLFKWLFRIFFVLILPLILYSQIQNKKNEEEMKEKFEGKESAASEE